MPHRSESKIVSLDRYRDRRRRPPEPKPMPEPAPALEVLDEAMRNLHAAANASLKLIFMARHRLGMTQL
ncbi:hypothetical protein [Luteimonas saliphila]|uniref:hypothetical protein n=1 Tax=Luteimonas saliphila TaxID=2804919 RepID=UPI00192E1FF7|nr:hypothetical protein [Luteimonas saliphila]